MVIIDTPPMLQMPDARVLGRSADAVILVTRAGQTTMDAVITANQRFANDGTRVLGTILNDWNPKSSASGHYG
jgi:Mrp family chromosome partitioning ATPase